MHPTPQRRTILLFEDEPLIRICIERYASARGYDVLSAADGCNALLRVKRGPCDILVTDINMPRVNGLKIIEAVRGERSSRPNLPIIAMSTEWANEPRARNLGADAFVTKPFDCEQLLGLVEELLSRPADS